MAAQCLRHVALALTYHRERFHEIESALRDGERLRTEGRLAEARQALAHGLDRARAIPGFGNLTRSLSQQLALVQRTQRAASVHELANLIRFRHAVDLPSADEARLLIKHIRTVWNERDALLGSNVESLDPQSEQVIRTDVLELAITWAELRLVRATAVEAEAARRDVEQLLNAALKWCGRSPRLDRLRQSISPSPEKSLAATTDSPTDFRVLSHYDRGRELLRGSTRRC